MNPYLDCGYCQGGRIYKVYTGRAYLRICSRCRRPAVVPPAVTLPTAHRETVPSAALIAMRSGGATYREIAVHFGMNQHTVKSRLYIARKNAEAGKEAV